MNIYSNNPIWPNQNIVGIILTTFFLSSFSVSEASINFSDEIIGKNRLVITGSEFYRRSQFDAGEIRIFFKNEGKGPISICQPRLSRLLDVKDNESHKAGTEVNYLYSKFSPPVLMPGRNGEILIKLLRSPPNNCKFQCAIYSETGWVSETLIAIKQAPIWISYVGFSEDLSKIYVYGQNNTKTPLTIRLLEVAGVNVGDDYQSINNDLPPGDKGCLVFKMPNRLTLGEYVHIVISAESNEQEFQTRRIVKAVNKFPLSSGGGFFSPKLGLDSRNYFVQTMSCPAHDHGTHKEAAGKFLDDYYLRFSQDACFLSQIWICRADRPRAWYTFGSLPDAAVINPVLSESQAYKSDTKDGDRFCPFFWLAATAKKAMAPNRFFACIPVNPEDGVFSQSNHTPEEIKFLVYCAIAAGAKGILYRDTPSFSRLSHDKFVRLNRELRQLKPLLSQGKSFSLVDWALAVSTKCFENHRPDLAEKLLTTTIDALGDKEKVVELRLKIAECYGKCGDNVAAAKRCKQIVEDFPDSLLYGKVMSSYFAYLARQLKAEEILAEIDSVLESPSCQRYLSQLIYLKWWALRKTNQQILAKKIGEQLIEDHERNPHIAPVLLAHATDALSNQQYEKCRQLLVQLTKNFPKTNSAKQAKKILVRLGRK
jgi:hypothetical protein